jgi:3-hydroxymyristoyl/3-hydroxydecanoyl-(acyl carrier protein) dehydratase
MSFSFVSRITAIEPGRWARGEFVPPPQLGAVPRWLAAEAAGQLAGWVAMAHCGFRRRLVAAIVGVVKIGRDGRAGETLELEVEVQERERATVTYRGSAHAGGRRVTELGRCVAPMLAMEEFDDAEAVRRRFDVLCAEGIVENTFDDPFERLRVEPLERREPQALEARLVIPTAAPFFSDHFPRRPVLPATLLTEALVRLALAQAHRAVGGDASLLEARSIRHVKVRAFSPPGHVLLLAARVRDVSEQAVDLAVSARSESRVVATAQVEVGRVGSDER